MMDSSDYRQNLKNTGTWFRLFFMFLFIIFMGVAINIFFIVMFIQILLSLFTGEPGIKARVFSAQVSRYMYQVLLYLGYAVEEKPFPFAPWPEPDLNLDYDTSLRTSVDDN